MAWARVIVVNHNGGPHLAGVLAALAQQTFPDFEAVVLDNGSSDGSFAAARDSLSDPRFRFVAAGANLGFAGGNNRAAEGAATPWLVFLNPDAYPEPDWLATLLGAAEAHPEAAAFGSTQVDFTDPTRLDGCGDVYGFAGVPWRGGHGHPLTALPADGETFSACAAAAMVRRHAFEEAGGFDTGYFCYVEDVDLGFRLRLLGHRCRQVGAARVRHVGGVSAGERSDLARYHGMRNMVLTFVKDMPGWLFWLLLPAHAAACLLALATAARRGFLAPIAGGLKAALAALPDAWRQRRRIQRARRVPPSAIARALCWSPAAMRRLAPQRIG